MALAHRSPHLNQAGGTPWHGHGSPGRSSGSPTALLQPSRLALPASLEATTEFQSSFRQLVCGLPFEGWSRDPERVWDVETISTGSCGAAPGLVRSIEASCKAVEGLTWRSCDAVSKRLAQV